MIFPMEEVSMERRMFKVLSKLDRTVALKVIPGHFVTNHSHISHYIDLMTLKSRLNEAKAAAKILAQYYKANTIVDTIVCIDGCEVIGAHLAEELTEAGIMSINEHQTIYVASPEYHTGGQLIFRDNMQIMVKGKNVLLLLATASTGKTLEQSLECIEYYGGRVSGIAAIFSAADQVHGIPVNAIFTEKDIPGYATYDGGDCPLCREGQRVDAIVNTYGYSKL